MADLLTIYHELGLEGLVPHALREGTRAHQMLLDKIKAGDPLYFIRTHMDAPYIVVKNDTYQAQFYTSEKLAQARVEELNAAGYRPEIEELPDGPGRKEALKWLYDHGPSAMLIDDSLSIALRTLVPDLPNYDGRPNNEHMLRNRQLNGATFYYLQQLAAGYGNPEAEQQWAKTLYHSELIVAVQNRPAADYPILSIPQHDGQQAVLVYTDWRQLGFDFGEDMPAGILFTFGELEQLLRENKNAVILLNQSTCHLILNRDMLEVIGQLATTGRGSLNAESLLPKGKGGGTRPYVQASEDDWDEIDPTPDFLK